MQPHRTETFKLSSDPLFIDKIREIVGLYLSPGYRYWCFETLLEVQKDIVGERVHLHQLPHLDGTGSLRNAKTSDQFEKLL